MTIVMIDGFDRYGDKDSGALPSLTDPPSKPTTGKVVFDYPFLLNVSREFKEHNDCAVVATCVVSGEGYPKIHEMYRRAGRRSRCATQWVTQIAIYAQLGLRLHNVTTQYPGRTVRTVCPQLPKDRRFLVRTADHVLGVVNGRAECWSHWSGRYVTHVDEVLDHHEQDPVKTVRWIEQLRGRWQGQTKASDVIRLIAEQAVWRWRQGEAKRMDARSLPRIMKELPRTRKFWLGIRAEIMEMCERQGIKRTTCSVELGKWQAELGYPMQEMC